MRHKLAIALQTASLILRFVLVAALVTGAFSGGAA